MENQDSGSKWKEYTGKIPDPRPGTVNTHTHTLIQTQEEMSPSSSALQQITPTEKLIQSKDAGEQIATMSGSFKDEAQNTTSLCHRTHFHGD